MSLVKTNRPLRCWQSRASSALRYLAVLCLCLALALVPAASWALTLEEERKMGKEALGEVLAQLPMVEDPDSLDFIRSLGKKLTARLADDPFDYHFYIANSPQYNAFALPGGWIFFFRGMITGMDTEAELASVMAHEISHVHYRHLADRIKKSGPLQMATIAGMIAGMLLGAVVGAPELGQAISLGSMAGGMQKQLAFSREAETQADYGAFQILSAQGYPPEDMAKSFRRIWRIQRYSMPDIPSYLLTHPSSPERLEQVENLARRHPVVTVKYDNSEFLRIKARLMALYDPVETANTIFQANLRQKPGDPNALYGLALLGMRVSRYEKSLEVFNMLPKSWLDRPSLMRDMGICHMRLGQFTEAQSMLNLALAQNSADASARMALGQSYLMQERLGLARDVFRRVLREDPDNHQAMYDLGIALGKLGKTGEASLNLGLAFMARHNQRAAKYHLERAQRQLSSRPDLQARATRALEKLEEGPPEKKPIKRGGEG